MKRIERQPRIRGQRRNKMATAFFNEMYDAIDVIARREGRTRSYVLAKFIGDAIGWDPDTGQFDREVTPKKKRGKR